MLMRHPTRAQNRRGVILMVVLALLTLFAIVGISFVLYADSEATAARIYRESQYVNRPDINPQIALSMFLSQFIYDVSDIDGSGIYSGLRGQSIARGIYGFNNVPNALNDKPFIGAGRLHLPSVFNAAPGAGVAADDAFLVNFTYFPGDGWLRDPEHFGTRANIPNTTTPNLTSIAAEGPYINSFNVPYTYPDHQNFFLAMMRASDGQVLVPSFHRQWLFGNLSDPNNPNWIYSWGKYLTLRPRPVDQLLQADVAGAGLPTAPWPPRPETWTPAQQTTLKTLIASLQAQGRLIPYPTDNLGDVKNLDWAPGGNDSIWIDINAPVITSADGRKYKMLVAPHIQELDSRLNLNAIGNILGTGNVHASNQGWNVSEVNPTKVITAAELANLFLGTNPQVVPQPNGAPSPAIPRVLGRYGRTGYPQGTYLVRPVMAASNGAPIQITSPNHGLVTGQQVNISGATGNTAANNTVANPLWTVTVLDPNNFLLNDSTGNANYMGGGVWYGTTLAPTGALQRSYAPADINGTADPAPNGFTAPAGLSFLFPGQGTNVPTSPFVSFLTTGGYGMGLPLEVTNNGMPIGIPNHPLFYNALRPQGDNRSLPISDMDPLLRNGGAGTAYMPSDLFQLAPSTMQYPNRNLTTLLSADLDLPGLVPYVWDRTDPNTRYKLPPLPGVPAPFGQPANLTTQGQPPIPFPPLPPPPGPVPPAPPNSEYDANTWRSLLFRLGRVDLNRSLTQYPMPYPLPGPFNTADPIVVAQLNQAVGDRQRLAMDVFNALRGATGCLDPGTAFGYTAAPALDFTEYNACRYLAQIAVNIVDYIDQDDFQTPFNWDPNRSTSDDAWVFGTELPRLVLNEVYVQYNNDPRDIAGMRATNPYRVNIWVELLNPFIVENGTLNNALLSSTIAGTTYNVYQIKIADSNLFPTPLTTLPNIRTPQNVRGDLIAVPGGSNDASNNFPPAPAAAGWGTNALQQFVVPVANSYNAPSGAIATASNAAPIQITSNGHGLVNGQQVIIVGVGGNTNANNTSTNPFWTVTVVDANNFTLNGSTGNAAYTNGGYWYAASTNNAAVPSSGFYTIGPLGPPAAGGDAPTYPASTNPNLPLTTYSSSMSYPVPTTATAFPAPTILLQRLAIPGIPPNPYNAMGQLQNPSLPYNPYITVDFVETQAQMTNDRRQWDAAGMAITPPATLPQPRAAFGRRQPYAANTRYAANTNTTQPPPPLASGLFSVGLFSMQNPAVARNGQVANTFFQHNGRQPPGTALLPWGNTPPTQDPAQTLTVPFTWLTHLDRQVSSPMELLHVSGWKPHELTQQFALPDPSPTTNLVPPAPPPFYNPEGIRFRHMAPWLDQTNRLYRFFELAQTRSWAAGVARGGRTLGKLNINMIWDQQILRALADAQQANLFFAPGPNTDANVDLVLAKLLQTRSPLGVPGAPFATPNGMGGVILPDQPIWSLTLGPAAGGFGDAMDPANVPAITNPPPPPSPRGINNTLLRGTPGSPTLLFDPFPADDITNNPASPNSNARPLHPYQRYQMLTKIFNNVTTRSNVFAVWLTVGFFEVMKDANGNYVGDLVRPVQLGAEVGLSSNQQVRHHMFAIIDRTNLQVAYTNTSSYVTNGVILNATNASPIQITSNSHGLVNGQVISITGVQGNTAANGSWVVTVIDPNNFTLNGTTGNGNYSGPGSGAWVTGISFAQTAGVNPNTSRPWVIGPDSMVVIEPNRGGAISNASNTGPIQITSFNHGLVAGQTVTIIGVSGNTAANGVWTISLVDPNNFLLVGSTGNGNYVPQGNGNLTGGTWCTNNEETVIVQNGPVANTFVAPFTNRHAPGVPVLLRGNPGPWPNYDPRNDALVVPYFAIID